MVDGGSPSSFVTYVADGYFADFYISVGGNLFVDVLMMVCSHRTRTSTAHIKLDLRDIHNMLIL